jgi:phosphoribosylanthranilate isomerase
MKPKIKICGITNLIDAKNALNLGADYIGFININRSSRFITTEEIEEILKSFSDEEKQKVVLLTDINSIDTVINISSRLGIKILQPYGSLSNNDLHRLRLLGYKIFKPINVASEDDLDQIEEYLDCTDVIILDTKITDAAILGGTGLCFDWDLYIQAKTLTKLPLGLAGGINIENLEEALLKCKPAMIDISSGLETSPGLKSLEKMKSLFALVSSLDLVHLDD